MMNRLNRQGLTALHHLVRLQTLWLLALLLVLGGCVARPQKTDTPVDVSMLTEWRAGETASEEAVAAFGLDNCFAAEPIPDRVWARMQG